MQDIWNAIVNWFKGFGVNVLESVAMLLIGILLVKLVRKILRRILHKTKLDGTAVSFIISIVQAFLALLIFFGILNILKIDTTSFIAIFTASGLAIGLALQDSISNLSSGLIILATKPFKENDHVVIGSVEGKVKKIKITTTEILTFDNITIIVPNGIVAKSEIKNISARPTRRLDITMQVAMSEDPDEVKKILQAVLKKEKRVLKTPAPSVIMSGLGESSIDFRIRVWVMSGDYWDVKFDYTENAFKAFMQHNIEIPYNTITVVNSEEKGGSENV